MKKVVNLIVVVCLIINLFSLMQISVYSAESNYVWPVPGVYTLSSYFNRPSYPNHNAIDINNCNGKAVVATKSGYLYVRNNTCSGTHSLSDTSVRITCTTANCTSSRGKYVQIDHGDGSWSEYAHLNSITNGSSRWVNQGDIIGYVGTTGQSTGPHLHFKVGTGVSGTTINSPQDPCGLAPTISANANGKNVTVNWANPFVHYYYDVYLIQAPWGWNDVKYSGSTIGNSYTFENVSPGSYQAFVIHRPMADATQSNWVPFNVANMTSNPWISANNSNNITVAPGTNVTLRYGADNATNYWLGIDRDGVRIETLDRTGTSEYTRNYEIGNYSAYISAGNSGGYIDSTRVNFTVAEKDYIPTKNISYNNKVYALYDYKTSWNVANDIANKIGGHLATISDSQEHSKLVELMSFGNKESYWLGGTDSATEGVWKWIDTGVQFWQGAVNGTTVNGSYTSWASGEPNNSNNTLWMGQDEDYLQIYKDGKWNDLPKIAAETSSVGFIVEIENNLTPVDTTTFNKNTYMLFDYDMTWTEANEYCKLLGGHLATISDANEQVAIETLVSKGALDFYYLGATDKITEGVWTWIDTGVQFWQGAGNGTTVNGSYTNWNTGQPDDYQGAEDYLHIYKSNKKWNDLSNYFSENTGFVCEIPFTQTPTAQITNGTSSYLLFDQYLSWEDAKIYCENLGGHLVTITSQEEQNVVCDLVSQGVKNQYWLGANYSTTNSWNWVTGESFSSYSNWDINQPDNVGVENYLQMYKVANPYNASSQAGKWNNTYVNNFRSGEAFFGIDKIGFICEFDNLNSYTKSNGFWFDMNVIASSNKETAKLEFYKDENYIDQRTFPLLTGINKLSLTAIGTGANKVKMYKNDELLLTRALNAYDESLTYGDVTNDNLITISDVAKLNQHINGTNIIVDTKQLNSADVNGDGLLSQIDVDLIYSFSKSQITQLTIQESIIEYDTNVKYGDVTSDGNVNMTDIVKVGRHVENIAYITDPIQLKAADVDGNGIINQTDFDLLGKYITNIITVFPIEMQVALNCPLVTFDTQGGSEILPINVSYNTQVTKPINPTKTGYIFEKWYSDSIFTNAFDFNMPITADITLFARWIPVNITIANLSTTKYGDTYKVTAEIQNDNQAKTDILVYIALYSETGKLLKLRNININIDAAKTLNVSEDFFGISECTTVKIFIWKSATGMQPISERKSCSVQLVQLFQI